MIKVKDRESFLIELNKHLPKRSCMVEIGVLHGNFSKIILDIINPKTLVLVDPYVTGGVNYGNELNNIHTAYSDEDDYINLLERFRSEISLEQVIVNRKFSYEAVDYFRNNTLDAIYNDASHLYEDVKSDLVEWLPKLKNGGVVCGHDYVSFADFGVMAAVDEFSKENGFEMIILNENGGDWALKQTK